MHLLLAAVLLAAPLAGVPARASASEGVYPMVEASFTLPSVTGDFFGAEILAEVTTAGQPPVVAPAFFDGLDGAGKPVWKVRFTPSRRGSYQMKIFAGDDPLKRVEASPANFHNAQFEVTGDPIGGAGFIRIHPATPQSFSIGGDVPFYPLGHDIGWASLEEIDAYFQSMRESGANWSRLWMTHFHGSNLDWNNDRPPPLGDLDLRAARWWDHVVASAGASGVYFQMVLQHHGQYSTEVNPNWDRNPWNAANGGFLTKPEEFFTDERAIKLTKRKYRYIIARYAWSPAIMAWELFNEVQFTDAYRHKQGEAITAWHEEMAAYMRKMDPWHHLVTSSSPPLQDPSWRTLDYYQIHDYPPDVVAVASGAPQHGEPLDKPYFYGEFGREGQNDRTDDGRILRGILWPSLMSPSSGSAQYWYWETLRAPSFSKFFAAAAGFVRETNLASRGPAWQPISATATSPELSDLVLPFRGYESRRSDRAPFDLTHDGSPVRIGSSIPATLVSRADDNRTGRPEGAALQLHCPEQTRLTLAARNIAPEGAALAVEVDGTSVAEASWLPPAEGRRRDVPRYLTVSLAGGDRLVTIRATGGKTVNIASIRVEKYLPRLVVVARGSDEEAIAWIGNREALPVNPGDGNSWLPPTPATSATGTISLPGLKAGLYRIRWWDTIEGKVMSEDQRQAAGPTLTLEVPAVRTDVACWVSLVSGH